MPIDLLGPSKGTEIIEICEDCVFFIAYGDVPEDETYCDRVAATHEARTYSGAWSVGDRISDFCSRMCQHCGSRLAGTRYEGVCLVRNYDL